MFYLKLLIVVLQLPFVLLRTYFTHNIKQRTLGNALKIAGFRLFAGSFTVFELNNLYPTGLDTYKKWCKDEQNKYIVDDLGKDGRILWIGKPKAGESVDGVIMLLPGGAYTLPVTDYMLSFWRHVQVELAKRGISVGLGVVDYGLIPKHNFPTQIQHASLALQFLTRDLHIPESKIIVAGDSAGGNLTLTLLAHLIERHPTVQPHVQLKEPLRGAFIMSALITPVSPNASWANGDEGDLYASQAAIAQARKMHTLVKPEFHPFIQHDTRSFAGLDKVVKRVLFTAGGSECFTDDIVGIANRLQGRTEDVQVKVHQGGVHDEVYLDFMFGTSKTKNPFTTEIVDWFANVLSS